MGSALFAGSLAKRLPPAMAAWKGVNRNEFICSNKKIVVQLRPLIWRCPSTLGAKKISQIPC
jgi:hypothetical protein